MSREQQEEVRAKMRVRRLARNGKLRELREERQLTQQDEGDYCGVDASLVSRWESNDRKISGKHALLVLELLLDGET